jgi:hypothetical protein
MNRHRFFFFLRRYFSSGWAFLMPYLFAYLIYFWRKWPVIPIGNHHHGGSGVLPLLCVYWALHGINLLLGALALCSWRSRPQLFGAPVPVAPKPGERLLAFLPWILLALLFLIPGTYLEFPSDPWEHLGRITRWADQNTIQTSYKNFGYSIPYTLIGGLSGNFQLFCLNIYYAGACLLLCWQYFRLGRAAGLGPSSAFIFVLFQALFLGNSSFSFYRYYGIASTLFSQIAAVAVIRVGLEIFRPKAIERPIRGLELETPLSISLFPGLRLPSVFSVLLSFGCLGALIFVDHIQGLAIAALGFAATAVWRLIAWRRSMIGWLAVAAFGASVLAVRCFPRDPAIDHIYRPGGLLTPWYGFNLLSLHSTAADGMMQILGLFGLINLFFGVALIARNHVVGWITVLPVAVLCLPCVAIPFSQAVAQTNGSVNIIIFQRLLLAVPAGLALVVSFDRLGRARSNRTTSTRAQNPLWRPRSAPCVALVAALIGLTTVPADRRNYNRFWNVMVKPADDLEMRSVVENFSERIKPIPGRPPLTYATLSGFGFILNVEKNVPTTGKGRTYYNEGIIPEIDIERAGNELAQRQSAGDAVAVIPLATMDYTAYSFAAICSRHWLPNEVAMAFSGSRELRAISFRLGMSPRNPGGPITYFVKTK